MQERKNEKLKSARSKLMSIIDQDSFYELDKTLANANYLNLVDYDTIIDKAQQKSGETEAVISGYSKIGGFPCIVFIMEPLFLNGSMGCVAGEKITRSFEVASQNNLPIISFSTSIGTRIHEGVFSLLQMAKTAGAVYQHGKNNLLFISIISGFTLGSVTASFASLADIIIAEEDSNFGFTNKQIIEETTDDIIPSDFQQSSYVYKRGQVDMVVQPKDLRDILITMLSLHQKR